MAIALLGYFSTMVATLVGFMVLLNTVLSSGMTEHARHRPYVHPLVAQAAAAVDQQAAVQPAAALSDQRLAAASEPVTAKNHPQKLATRHFRRKEEAAGREQDREYSLALGYSREAQRQPNTAFGPFRF